MENYKLPEGVKSIRPFPGGAPGPPYRRTRPGRLYSVRPGSQLLLLEVFSAMNKYAIYLNGVFMSFVFVPLGLGARTKSAAIEAWKAAPKVLGPFGDNPYGGAVSGRGFTITAKRKGTASARRAK